MRRSFVSLACELCLIVGLAAGLVLCAPGCRLIDEDRSDCPEDLEIQYTLNLITNLQLELALKLGTEKDAPLRAALEDYLKDIFVDKARDVDLSFYDIKEPGSRKVHRQEIMNADQATYIISLPADDYKHLGIANMAGERSVVLTGDEYAGLSTLMQTEADIIKPHNTGLFTARKDMQVLQGVSQSFEVNLYMANDAAALIAHRDSCDAVKVWMEVEGLANSFTVRDSLYDHSLHTLADADYIDATPYVEATSVVRPSDDLATKAGELVTDSMYGTWTKVPAILCTVGFPSKDPGQGTTVEGADGEVLWIAHVYATLADGRTTKTSVMVGEPLPAGNLMILRGWLRGDGSFVPGPPTPGGGDDMVVGVSVTLNWQQGPVFNPTL